MEMTWLFILMKYNRYMSDFVGLVHTNDIRTWWITQQLYAFVHSRCCYMMFIPFSHLIASYEIGTMILLIAQDFVFRHRLFRYGFRFFTFLLTLQFCVSLQLMGLQLNRGCSFS